jgi:hypothetical protein
MTKKNAAVNLVETPSKDSVPVVTHYGSPLYETIKSVYQVVLQNLILMLPKISETRLAANKTMAFLKAWHYLSRAGITGDYLEFGVFRGVSFQLALRSAGKFFPRRLPTSPRFFAFDSFAGLPEIHQDRDSNVFQAGQYRSSQERFWRGIRRAARGWQVKAIPGFFNDSLHSGLASQLELRHAAFVTIDCDLYEGTWDVLRFVSPLLSTGSILYFDDWYSSGGDMQLGEAGACREWLAQNPHFSLHDYGNVGIMGKMFIVNRTDR